MTENAVKERILRLAEPLAHALGLVVWGVEITRAHRMTIQLFIDLPPAQAPSSPSVDMCEKISRALGLALEVEDCLSEPYMLEVSTPGLSRLFFNQAQMRPYLGDIVEARLHPAPTAKTVENSPAARKLWRGKLLEVEDEAFVIAPVTITESGDVIPENSPPVRLLWKTVRRANRAHIFRMPVKPGKTPKKRPEHTDKTVILTPPPAAAGGTHES
ncbi:MAG: ribosome maturation factor RimP [Desulfovibrio sp.]|jgi:ribosome maturation factor RimP|nr:ribosome maturation factor RimP [Desulfovibrio sp.]